MVNPPLRRRLGARGSGDVARSLCMDGSHTVVLAPWAGEHTYSLYARHDIRYLGAVSLP